MRAKLMILATVAACGGLWPSAAFGDSLRPISDGQASSEDIVRDLLAHALAAFRQGAFKEASDYYRAAVKRKPTREITCNLGVSARLAENLIEAAYALTACLAAPPPLPISEEETQRIARYRGDLEVVLGQIGTLSIQAPAGVDILIDNEPSGRAPLATDAFVKPGSHVVVVRHKGLEASRSIVVGKGTRAIVSLAPAAKREAPNGTTATATRPRSRAVVIAASIATTLILGGGLSVFGASRAVGSDVASDLEASRKGNPSGCAVPTPSTSCATASSSWKTAATLTKLGMAGVITGGMVGGGTVLYVAATSPEPAPSRKTSTTGFAVGWRGTW